MCISYALVPIVIEAQNSVWSSDIIIWPRLIILFKHYINHKEEKMCFIITWNIYKFLDTTLNVGMSLNLWINVNINGLLLPQLRCKLTPCSQRAHQMTHTEISLSFLLVCLDVFVIWHWEKQKTYKKLKTDTVSLLWDICEIIW